jgi:hypothetical protein
LRWLAWRCHRIPKVLVTAAPLLALGIALLVNGLSADSRPGLCSRRNVREAKKW